MSVHTVPSEIPSSSLPCTHPDNSQWSVKETLNITLFEKPFPFQVRSDALTSCFCQNLSSRASADYRKHRHGRWTRISQQLPAWYPHPVSPASDCGLAQWLPSNPGKTVDRMTDSHNCNHPAQDCAPILLTGCLSRWFWGSMLPYQRGLCGKNLKPTAYSPQPARNRVPCLNTRRTESCPKSSQ